MAKIGRPEEKPFNPISGKVLADLTSPVKPAPPEDPPPPTPIRARSAPVRPVPEPTPIESERLERTKRFKLTQSEEIEIDEATQRLASALRKKINFSHVSRCLWQLYLRNEEAILDRVRRNVSAPRPHNADSKALAQFEEQLLVAIIGAVAASPDR